MFDLDTAVREWRSDLERRGTMREADLVELESHLLDEVSALADCGLSLPEALSVARSRLGDEQALASEYHKVRPWIRWQRVLFWMTAGCLFGTVSSVALDTMSQLSLFVGRSIGAPVAVMQWSLWAIYVGVPITFILAAVAIARAHGLRGQLRAYVVRRRRWVVAGLVMLSALPTATGPWLWRLLWTSSADHLPTMTVKDWNLVQTTWTWSATTLAVLFALGSMTLLWQLRQYARQEG